MSVSPAVGRRQAAKKQDGTKRKSRAEEFAKTGEFLAEYISSPAFMKQEKDKRRELFLTALSAHLHDTEIAKESSIEKRTGLGDYNQGRLFRHRSRLLESVKDDPRFAPELQIMVDLDATLFPVDRAWQEKGIDLDSAMIDMWGNGGDQFGDKLMLLAGREDLLYEKAKTPEQEEERLGIIVDFFEDLHNDEELMKRAGVFEFSPQVIRELRKQGVRVHIVTHRSPSSADETEAWLRAMGVEYDAFICDLPDKADKIKYCQEQGITVLLDDKPSTIQAAEDVGIEAISLSWPYSDEALAASGGDRALCWREMAHHAVAHMERDVLRRAKELGIELPLPEFIDNSPLHIDHLV